MQIDLDRTDRRILTALSEDGGLSAAEVAERVGLSQSPCWRRINRLEKEGVIRQRATVVDRKKVGLDTMIFAHVKLSAHGKSRLNDFASMVRSFPEVLECYVTLGDMDFLLKIVTHDIEAYEKLFFNHLSQLPGVQEIRSSIALSEIKYTLALPIPETS